MYRNEIKFLLWAYMFTRIEHLFFNLFFTANMWFKEICPNLTKGYKTYICADYVETKKYKILCFKAGSFRGTRKYKVINSTRGTSSHKLHQRYIIFVYLCYVFRALINSFVCWLNKLKAALTIPSNHKTESLKFSHSCHISFSVIYMGHLFV